MYQRPYTYENPRMFWYLYVLMKIEYEYIFFFPEIVIYLHRAMG